MSEFRIDSKKISGKMYYQVMHGSVQIGDPVTSEAEAQGLIAYRESLTKAGEMERVAEEKQPTMD